MQDSGPPGSVLDTPWLTWTLVHCADDENDGTRAEAECRQGKYTFGFRNCFYFCLGVVCVFVSVFLGCLIVGCIRKLRQPICWQ